MSHVQRRKAEIAAQRAKQKPPKARAIRRTPIKIERSDGDVLRFIAERLRNCGMPNFAVELERIAAAGSQPHTESGG